MFEELKDEEEFELNYSTIKSIQNNRKTSNVEK